ncbi:hypothetical protein IFM89_020392 [Coptis chinensis]|uniref:Cyclin C-terminal domain-containing protein n=1 Tax=Coptis chinensis TaxID=261450 RepID=A0A835IQ01_9MAGN|nr:hypothetical protein IFM89_020392 [Coptis chinensis]
MERWKERAKSVEARSKLSITQIVAKMGSSSPYQSEESLSGLFSYQSRKPPSPSQFQGPPKLKAAPVYILNWIYRYFVEKQFSPWISCVSGFVQTALYADFFYYYFLRGGSVTSDGLSVGAGVQQEVPLQPLRARLEVRPVCESKFIFEARTILRMELLVLSTLNWRMQAIIPFSFMDYFLWKFNHDQPPLRSSISQSVDIILSILKGIEHLNFRPSEVAAAVAISVLRETQTVDVDKALRQHLERVLKCIKLIQDVSLISGAIKVANGASVPYVPQSPIGVLDAACLSYKSDDLTVGSCANSSHSSPEGQSHEIKFRPTCICIAQNATTGDFPVLSYFLSLYCCLASVCAIEFAGPSLSNKKCRINAVLPIPLYICCGSSMVGLWGSEDGLFHHVYKWLWSSNGNVAADPICYISEPTNQEEATN